MTLAGQDMVVLSDKDLENWVREGAGGFGKVYKVRHKGLGIDVAVKILKRDASHTLFENVDNEAKFIKKASFEYVLRFYGSYEGPKGEKGLVTEYMKRGSIETLQKNLKGPPPWPLAFRLAHETAIAMNFLHRQEIVHQDLKPSNVLLSNELSVRLADFGLSTKTTSVVWSSGEAPAGPRGTWKYMPPEAFSESYIPTRAFDVYSFGVLLWSIFSGKEPYSGRHDDSVEQGITGGGRPGCRNNQADLLMLQVEGIKEMVDLMRNCWNQHPNNRPHFKDIHEQTEDLFSKHERNVLLAVHEVLIKLDSPNQAFLQRQGTRNAFPSSSNMEVLQAPESGDSGETKTRKEKGAHRNDVVDFPQVTEGSAQSDSSKTMTTKEKAKFVDKHRKKLIQKVTHILAIADELGVGPGETVHNEAYDKLKAKETPADKVREFYGSTLRSGDEVKAAFYDALMIHENPLMKSLGQ